MEGETAQEVMETEITETEKSEVQTDGVQTSESNAQVDVKKSETNEGETSEHKVEGTDVKSSEHSADETGDVKNHVANGTSEDITDKKLLARVKRQVEYYFGNFNLPRDKFLKEEVKKDDGWIPLATLLKFKRLASMTTDQEKIMLALENSDMIEIDKENVRVRRSVNKPLPEVENYKEESIKRTVYVKGFPKDGSTTLDVLFEFMDPYGPYDTIIMRNFHDARTKKGGFKGSVLVVFETEEKAKEFIKKQDLKYNRTPLILKWYTDYLEEKDREIKERLARKEAKKAELKEALEEACDASPFPGGAFLHLSSLAAGTTREHIRDKLKEFTDLVAYVEYSQGQPTAYIRLSEENSNKPVLEKIGTTVKINNADITVRIVEGDEEKEQMKKASEARALRYSASKKRRMQGGQGGGRGKKRRR